MNLLFYYYRRLCVGIQNTELSTTLHFLLDRGKLFALTSALLFAPEMK